MRRTIPSAIVVTPMRRASLREQVASSSGVDLALIGAIALGRLQQTTATHRVRNALFSPLPPWEVLV